MACGCLVLTQDYHEIENEFIVGYHLKTWTEIDELVAKCQYYLNHRDEAIEIGQNASEYVKQYCNWDYRMAELKTLINKYKA